ncbi:MAG: hypothetical protein LBH87_00530, partial [Coriobacteriales bacterium]|nr:hypothetical protein [Coriobacteriales bacterium]
MAEAISVKKPRPRRSLVIRLLIASAILLVGVGVLCYPKFANFLYDHEVSKQKQDFLEVRNKKDPRFEALYQYLKG